MPYGVAFALTVLIEVPVVLSLLSPRPRWSIAVVTAVGVNVVTHPLVWFGLAAAGDRYWTMFPVAEIGAWLVEAAIVAVVWPRPARSSVLPVLLVANALSSIVGLLTT